jgi:VIT1/CCC1 family predicted Fe2+/Mn2+ transporter
MRFSSRKIMGNRRKERLLLAMRDLELLHEQVFCRLSEMERNKELKQILAKLSSMEGVHASLWQKLVGSNTATRHARLMQFAVSVIAAMRKIIGVALTTKIMERVEYDTEDQLDSLIKKGIVTKKERAAISDIDRMDERDEAPLEKRIIMHGGVLNNIRDVTFGMNDGLVEVLAAVAGFGVALQAASLVLVAGFIVAVSGTLSMAAGAYLATNYEKNIHEKESQYSSAGKSAYYVGLFYLIGALFPVAPFAFGIGGYHGIMLSILVTALVLIIVSTLIAIVSDVKISHSMTKTLIISLGAVAVTMLLGSYARSVLHINI